MTIRKFSHYHFLTWELNMHRSHLSDWDIIFRFDDFVCSWEIVHGQFNCSLCCFKSLAYPDNFSNQMNNSKTNEPNLICLLWQCEEKSCGLPKDCSLDHWLISTFDGSVVSTISAQKVTVFNKIRQFNE
jgi:hypothetical protein